MIPCQGRTTHCLTCYNKQKSLLAKITRGSVAASFCETINCAEQARYKPIGNKFTLCKTCFKRLILPRAKSHCSNTQCQQPFTSHRGALCRACKAKERLAALRSKNITCTCCKKNAAMSIMDEEGNPTFCLPCTTRGHHRKRRGGPDTIQQQSPLVKRVKIDPRLLLARDIFQFSTKAQSLFARRQQQRPTQVFLPDADFSRHPQWAAAQPRILIAMQYLILGNTLNFTAHNANLNQYIQTVTTSGTDLHEQACMCAKTTIPPFTLLGLCVGDYFTLPNSDACKDNYLPAETEKYVFTCASTNCFIGPEKAILMISTARNPTMHSLHNAITPIAAVAAGTTPPESNVTTLCIFHQGWPYMAYVSLKLISEGETLLLNDSQAHWKDIAPASGITI